MTYRVNFYDMAGKLVCWYSTPCKRSAESMMNTKFSRCVLEMIEHA
jgi:hypothetical protein